MEEDGADAGGFLFGAATLLGLVDAGYRNDGRRDGLTRILRGQNRPPEIAGQPEGELEPLGQPGLAVVRQAFEPSAQIAGDGGELIAPHAIDGGRQIVVRLLPIASAKWPKIKDPMGRPSSVAAKIEPETIDFSTVPISGATK